MTRSLSRLTLSSARPAIRPSYRAEATMPSNSALKGEAFLILTPYGPNSFFFRRFSGHNLRQALFVYRLIGATLIGNFFLLKIELKFGEKGDQCPPGR